MMKIAFALLVFLATFSIVSEASAVVCARGVARAGCVGPHGAVVAHRPVGTVGTVGVGRGAVVAPVVRRPAVRGVRVYR